MGRKPKQNKGDAVLNLFPELQKARAKQHVAAKKATVEVHDDLKEAKRPKVKEYYPIYSDEAGAWQADLMFINYVNQKQERRSHSFLCLVNINTKYAFVKQLTFRQKKDEDLLWKAGPKSTPGRTPGSVKTAKNTAAALKHIFEKEMPREETWLRSPEGADTPDAEFELNVIYTDEGGEFKGEFDAYCKSLQIRHVVFNPNEGKKTRLGIVERFNRTLRRYYTLWVKSHPLESKYFPNVLPKVMDNYNRYVTHSSIRKFYRHMAHGERLPRGMVYAPKLMMMAPEREAQWKNWKQEREEQVDNDWRHTIDALGDKPQVRYFKNALGADKKQFDKSGSGTLSKYEKVVGPNMYTKPGEHEERSSKGWRVPYKSGYASLLPYDLIIK